MRDSKKIIIIGSILILILVSYMIFTYMTERPENKEIRPESKNEENRTLTILAFDDDGNQLNYNSFKSKLRDTLLVSTIDDNYVDGRPWLKQKDDKPIIEWRQNTIKISIAWELPTTGYSTIYLDNEGQGYSSSQVINFNFEALKTQWGIFKKYYDQRKNSKLPYIPSRSFLELYEQTKVLVDQTKSSQIESQKALYSNKGLDKLAEAWELMLREYGIQYGKKYYQNKQNKFGITIEDLSDYEQKLDMAKAQGNDYVRIVFDSKKDFTFANERTFKIYDNAIYYAKNIGLEIMGEVLDSELWPKDITVDEYRQRTHNLANHYKGKISVWEIGNEINGNWIGGDNDPISDSQIVDSINAAADDIKIIDSNLKTVITLYWGEGAFKDDSHPLFIWINKWKKNKNFGNNIDIIALSIYPQYDPVGTSFDIMINKLHEKFPDKKIMIGEFGYFNDPKDDSQPYWWHSKDIVEIQKYLIEQYYISMMGYDYSIGGGFWWNFSDMTNNELYSTYKNVIDTFKKS